MRKVLRKLSPQSANPDNGGPDAGPKSGDVETEDAALDALSRKKLISIRLDADVIAFFQDEGAGYQTRMNAVLRSYMNARKDSA